MTEHWSPRPGWDSYLPNESIARAFWGDLLSAHGALSAYCYSNRQDALPSPAAITAELSARYFQPTEIGSTAEVVAIDAEGVTSHVGGLLGFIPGDAADTVCIGLQRIDDTISKIPLSRSNLLGISTTCASPDIESPGSLATVLQNYAAEVDRLMESSVFQELGIEHQREYLQKLLLDADQIARLMTDDNDAIISLQNSSPRHGSAAMTLRTGRPYVTIPGLGERQEPYRAATKTGDDALCLAIPYDEKSIYVAHFSDVVDIDFEPRQDPPEREDLLNVFFADPNIVEAIRNIEARVAYSDELDELDECHHDLQSLIPDGFFEHSTFSISGFVYRFGAEEKQSVEYTAYEHIVGRSLEIEWVDGKFRVVIALESDSSDSTMYIVPDKDHLHQLVRYARMPRWNR